MQIHWESAVSCVHFVPSGDGRICQRYGGSLPEHPVSELHKPDGDADRLYAEIHKDPYRRSVPQRTGMFGEIAGKTGHGRQVGRQKRTDRRYQSYGMAVGTA